MTGESSKDIYYTAAHSTSWHSLAQHTDPLEENSTIIPTIIPSTSPTQVHSRPRPDGVAQHAGLPNPQFVRSCITTDSTDVETPGGDLQPQHNTIASPSAIADPPIDFLGSSQRTTSYFPAVFVQTNFNMLHCIDSLDPYSTSSRPPDEGSRMISSTPEMPWTADDFRWYELSQNAGESPVSSRAESCSDDCLGDSNAEEDRPMSPSMHHVQLPSSIHPSLSSQDIQRGPPAILTFQLTDSLMQPVYDPENEQILQSFHNIGIYGDDDTDSAGSFTVQSSPVLHDATLSGSAVVIQDRRCKNETLVGTSQSCPSSGPHIVSCTLRRSASQTPRSGSTPPKHKPVKRPRPKMHECVVCRKQFPRPSGLATHMNSHSGERPFKCLVEGCDKSFAVRSNARRHLKTHGINPATYDTSPTTSYTVGFEQPVVNDVHDTGKQPSRYRWIPQSPAPHTNVWLCSSAPTGYFPLSLAASLSCSDDDNLDEDSCQQPAPDGDQW